MVASQIKILMVLACMLVNQKSTTRTVYIFADKTNNAKLMQQLNILKADPTGIKARDLVFKVVTQPEFNQPQYKSWHIQNFPFTVLLIGKDNGEKLRSHDPVTLTRLFDLIDNMPMRREEARRQRNLQRP